MKCASCGKVVRRHNWVRAEKRESKEATMLPKHDDTECVPTDTAQLAQRLFEQDHYCMVLREKLGVVYEDEAFATLFSSQGQPAVSPARLAMTTILQYMEGLSDRQAVKQVVARIDWKYLLGLPLDDEGFDASVLSEFRSRLIAGQAEEILLTHLLEICRQEKLLKERGKQRTDSTHVLAAVRQLNRLEMVTETMRHALNALAAVVPEWLSKQVPPEWFERYGTRVEEYRLPESKAGRERFADSVGVDGHHLWLLLHQKDAPAWLCSIPAVETLRQVWVQQYYVEQEQVHWRKAVDLPPCQQRLQSPYDVEARYSQKGNTRWLGYKVHLTETCDEGRPHLIIHAHTTPSTQPDQSTLPEIQQALADRELLPGEHLVDAGYVDATSLVTAQQHAVDLVGPLEKDTSWQGRTPDAFDLTCFVVDWEAKQVTCPGGHVSQVWSEGISHSRPVIRVHFRKETCIQCPLRQRCTSAKTKGRTLHMHLRDEHLALQRTRARQQTPEFKEAYRLRAGIEGTISQGTRAFELRRTRYMGFAKTHLQHIILAVSINLTRLAAWFAQAPLVRTRVSRFAALRPAT